MARGKYAVRAAKHAVEARDELIDRLTDELAEAKRRARQVEAQARRVPELERRLREAEQREAEDAALAEVLKRGSEWYGAARRRLEALHHWQQAFRDLWMRFQRIADLPEIDTVEYLVRRYPKIFTGPDVERLISGGASNLHLSKGARGLSDEAIRRIQIIQKRRLAVSNAPDAASLIEQAFLSLEEKELSLEGSNP